MNDVKCRFPYEKRSMLPLLAAVYGNFDDRETRAQTANERGRQMSP